MGYGLPHRVCDAIAGGDSGYEHRPMVQFTVFVYICIMTYFNTFPSNPLSFRDQTRPLHINGHAMYHTSWTSNGIQYDQELRKGSNDPPCSQNQRK